jgi:hypothetical protein
VGSGGGLELDDVELAVPLLALCELGFRGASIARSGDGAGVLGSEPCLQPLRASAPCDDHSEQRDDDHDDDDDDQQTGVHGLLLSGTWMPHGSHGDACLLRFADYRKRKELNNRARLVVRAGRVSSGITAAPRDLGRPPTDHNAVLGRPTATRPTAT